MKQPKHTCYMCGERRENCHSTCDEYIYYRKQYDKYKNMVLKNKSKSYLYIK